MATYFRLEVNGLGNEDSKRIFQDATPMERQYLLDLWGEKEADLAREVVGFEETYEVFDLFSSYKMVCEKSDEPNSDKLGLIIAFKQIFCVPLLLCSKQLLSVVYKGQI